MPYSERAILEHGLWDDAPGIFLPSKVIDLCHSLVPDPPPDVMTCIALLAWVTVSEVREYYDKLEKSMADTRQADEERERWKNHKLYRTQTKLQLERA